MRKILVLVIMMAASAAARGVFAGDAVRSITLPEVKTELKAGEGKEKTSGLCGICHSLDYITTQPALSRAQWTATVNKMIKVMGAPVNEEDAKIIINYLAAQYGTGK